MNIARVRGLSPRADDRGFPLRGGVSGGGERSLRRKVWRSRGPGRLRPGRRPGFYDRQSSAFDRRANSSHPSAAAAENAF